MQVDEQISKALDIHTTLWECGGEGRGYSAPMSNDERQYCDSSPAKLKKSLSEAGMLLVFVHSAVMQVCVTCEGDL